LIHINVTVRWSVWACGTRQQVIYRYVLRLLSVSANRGGIGMFHTPLWTAFDTVYRAETVKSAFDGINDLHPAVTASVGTGSPGRHRRLLIVLKMTGARPLYAMRAPVGLIPGIYILEIFSACRCRWVPRKSLTDWRRWSARTCRRDTWREPHVRRHRCRCRSSSHRSG
jgi:hypothetical protein